MPAENAPLLGPKTSKRGACQRPVHFVVVAVKSPWVSLVYAPLMCFVAWWLLLYDPDIGTCESFAGKRWECDEKRSTEDPKQFACIWCPDEGSCVSIRKLEEHASRVGDLNRSDACSYAWDHRQKLPDNNVQLRDPRRGRMGKPIVGQNLNILSDSHPACVGTGQLGTMLSLQGAYTKTDGEVANATLGEYTPPMSRFSTSGYAPDVECYVAIECPYKTSASVHFQKLNLRPEDTVDIFDAEFKDRDPRATTEVGPMALRAHTKNVQRHISELLKGGKSGSGEDAFQGLASEPGTALVIRLTSQPLLFPQQLPANASQLLVPKIYTGFEFNYSCVPQAKIVIGETIVDIMFCPGAITLLIIAMNQLYRGFCCRTCARDIDKIGPAHKLHEMDSQHLLQLYKSVANAPKAGPSRLIMIEAIEAAMTAAADDGMGGRPSISAEVMLIAESTADDAYASALEGEEDTDADEWIDVSWSSPGFWLDFVSCAAGGWEGYQDFVWVALQLHRQTFAGYATAFAAGSVTAFSTIMFLVGDKLFKRCARGKNRDRAGDDIVDRCDKRFGKVSPTVVNLLTLFQLRVQVEGMIFYRNLKYEAEDEEPDAGELAAQAARKPGCLRRATSCCRCKKRRIRQSKYETLKSNFDRALLQEGILEALPQMVIEWQNLFQPGFTSVYRVMPFLYVPGKGNLMPYVSEYTVMSVIAFFSAFLGVVDLTTPYTPSSGLETITLLAAGVMQLFGRMMFFVALLCMGFDRFSIVAAAVVAAMYACTWQLVRRFNSAGLYHPSEGQTTSANDLVPRQPVLPLLAFVNMFVPTDGNLFRQPTSTGALLMTLVRAAESAIFVAVFSAVHAPGGERRVRHIAFLSIFLQLGNFALLSCLAVSEDAKDRALITNPAAKRNAMTPRSILLLGCVLPVLGMSFAVTIQQLFQSYELEAGYLPFAAECKATVALSLLVFAAVGLVVLLSGDAILVFTTGPTHAARWEDSHEQGRKQIKDAKRSDRKWTAATFGVTLLVLLVLGLLNMARNHPREVDFNAFWSPCFNDGVGNAGGSEIVGAIATTTQHVPA